MTWQNHGKHFILEDGGDRFKHEIEGTLTRNRGAFPDRVIGAVWDHAEIILTRGDIAIPSLDIHSLFKADDFYRTDRIQIPGERLDEVVIIGAHYDSWWCQGAADDSGSISVVWGIAKYFADNNIKPYYTLKFAAWAGEEQGCRGSKSYVEEYQNQEEFKYYINLGAIGYENSSEVPKEDVHLHMYHNKRLSEL